MSELSDPLLPDTSRSSEDGPVQLEHSNDTEAITNTNYKIRNLFGFNFTGFFCIAFIIFLTSSQPFFISQILNIDHHIGRIIGTLGFVDELTSIVTSPLVGTLNDKLNTWSIPISGAKIVVCSSFVLIFVSFLLYGLVPYTSWVQLAFPRIIFAIAITSCMSMVPVLLNQIIYSDFKFSTIFFWKKSSVGTVNNVKKNGRYAAMIGLSTGLGAVFSVSCFLTLPVRISDDYSVSSKQALKVSFVILGCASLLVSGLMAFSLYDKKKPQNVIDNTIVENVPYTQLLQKGFQKCKENSTIQLACLGGLVARSTSVLIAVFIPLFVYNYYYKSGLCDNDGTLQKVNCYNGYTFSAILTGVAQTISLISSPVWGIVIDKLGKRKALVYSSVFGVVGNWLICILNIDDPRNALTFVLVSFIGISQIGTVITSMSLISPENDAIGSVSGVYNFCGGIGILLLSQIGGFWSDSWVLAPFFLMGLFNGILIVMAIFK